MSVSFNTYKQEAYKAAKHLKYGKETLSRILNAETSNEITRIMKTKREEMADE